MEAQQHEMCDSLIKWFKVLGVSAPHSTPEELSDGVAVAQALFLIAPESFSESWLSKIKAASNWRLKVSNLKKVVEGVLEYYNEVLSLNLVDFARPDVLKIAEHFDQIEMGRLLQLILGCAVNCVEKQNYITQIMELEESLQRNIMQALQELETMWLGASASARASMSMAGFDVKAMQDERDQLAQKCHESERQIAFLIEEKSSMQQELHKLQQELHKYENPGMMGDDGASLGPVQPGSTRYNDMRRQMDALKDELMQVETTRDDLKMKSTQQEKDIAVMQAKLDEMHAGSVELEQLRDEMDALREASDKQKHMETQLATYKKKLEDHNDLKKQVKMLEERSAEYLRQNVQTEEEAKKSSTLKGQVELYKKEILELHSKLDTEMSKSVKIEFEMGNLNAKLTSLQREKDNLLSERDVLRETCDELRCQQSGTGDGIGNMSTELTSPAMKEKIERLEAENKALREGQGGQTALAQLLEDANQRNEKVREQLRTANQKILVLSQGQVDDTSGKSEMVIQLRQALEMNEQRAGQLDEAHTQLGSLQSKVGQLEACLTAREQELSVVDARHRKFVEKAKEVIKNLDPRGANEAAILEKTIDGDSEQPQRQGMSQMEEHLIVSSYYKLGLACHREAVESRLALLAGPGQSFLSRQRQPAARKAMGVAYKTK